MTLSVKRRLGKITVLLVCIAWCTVPCAWSTEHAGQASLRCRECNLVIISLDTLRADHLGAHGYQRATSPTIDAFARRHIFFENAYSPSSKTAEAHMSLFTSLYPSVHGVRSVGSEEKTGTRLSDDITTLAQILKKNKYSTASFHNGGQLNPRFGFDKGFHTCELKNFTEYEEFLSIVHWIRKRSIKKKKFFLFLHTYHVHDPYAPHIPYDRYFNPTYQGQMISGAEELWHRTKEACTKDAKDQCWSLREKTFWDSVDFTSPADRYHLPALYDGAIREMDRHFGILLDLLEHTGRDTIIVVLSDHGEEFFEHGDILHKELYQEIIHVPLVIKHPGVKGHLSIKEAVSLVDIAPTVLDLLAIGYPNHFQGRTLVPLIQGQTSSEDIFSELPILGKSSLISGNKKIILKDHYYVLGGPIFSLLERVFGITDFPGPAGYKEIEVYDLSRDPQEQNSLGLKDPDSVPLLLGIQSQMKKNEWRKRKLNRGSSPKKVQLKKEEIEQLKALGYVQ